MNFKYKNEPLGPLFKQNNILRFRDNIKLLNCLFIYDQLKHLLSPIFSDFFIQTNHHNHNTRGANTLIVPQKKTVKYGINSITYQAILTWNTIAVTLNFDIRNYNRNKFRNLIYKHMTSSY